MAPPSSTPVPLTQLTNCWQPNAPSCTGLSVGHEPQNPVPESSNHESWLHSHVGRHHGDPGDGDIRSLLSDEARTADDRAFFLKVRDVSKAALDEGLFRRQVDRLRAAAGMPITSDHLDRVVDVTAKRFSLSEDESAGVLAHLLRGGDLSQWGLCSAITRHSQDLTDYDRASELERIGGKLVELPSTDWLRIASAN